MMFVSVDLCIGDKMATKKRAKLKHKPKKGGRQKKGGRTKSR
jgi:hypothetical protein